MTWFKRANNGRFSSIKMFVKRIIRMTFRLSLLGGALYTAGVVGATFYPNTVIAENTVEVEVIKEPEYPILDRIAQCESKNKHYGKSGQVLMVPNTNGTVDVGRHQINTVWFAKATELGLDITKEEDNRAMAEWIYLNRGTEDWYSSKKCWQK